MTVEGVIKNPAFVPAADKYHLPPCVKSLPYSDSIFLYLYSLLQSLVTLLALPLTRHTVNVIHKH